MDADKTLPDLTPDGRIWRLDWLGEVAYPGHINRFTQPNLKVTLSPLLCDPDDNEALQGPDCTNTWETHETWVPVSTLPLLSIGALWKNGNELKVPHYQLQTFTRLAVKPETTSFIKAGLSTGDIFYLPLGRHPWHRPHTQSYCVSVTLDDDRRVVIPCMELIRFYFGSSGNLVQRLFTTPLVTNALWAKKRYDESKRHLHIVLADRLPGSSAADIGRIAASKFARRSAAGIYASCQKAAAQRECVYPYTGFPFEGKTDLFASGTWLPYGDTPDATFIVFRFRSCSYPFPFLSLSYESGDKKIWHQSHTGSGSGNGKFSQRTKNRPKNYNNNTDPSKDKPQRTHKFKKEHRFPDLVQKSVWRDKIEAIPEADVFMSKENGKFEQVSHGESNYCSDTRGIDTISQSKNETYSLPKFVKTGLFLIDLNPNFITAGSRKKVVTLPGKSGPIFNIPLIMDDTGEVAESFFMVAPDGGMRVRQACFIEIHRPSSPIQYVIIAQGTSWEHSPAILSTKNLDTLQASILLTSNQ